MKLENVKCKINVKSKTIELLINIDAYVKM